MSAQIPLTAGHVALVDDADARRVLAIRWRALAQRSTDLVYAMTSVRNRETGRNDTVFLHRWLMAAPPEVQVDHINHNGLDNRTCNLRLASRSANLINQRRNGSRNKHGFHGICEPTPGLFYGRISIDGRDIYTPGCRTPEEAARAWDELATRHFGSFVQLNFPSAATAQQAA